MTTRTSTDPQTRRSNLYSAVIGLAGVVVLLQGVWAGMFIREGKDNSDKWVKIHAHGADLAILLAIVAAVVVFVQLRERRDLFFGTIAFAVLLVVEGRPQPPERR